MDKRKGPIKVKLEKDRTKDSHDPQARDKSDLSETSGKVQVKEEKSRQEKVEVDTISESLDGAKDKGNDILKLCKTIHYSTACVKA